MQLIVKTKNNSSVTFAAEVLGKHSVLVGNMLDYVEIPSKEEMVLPFYNISNETMLKIKAFLEGFDPNAGPERPVTSENCRIEQIFKDD